MDRLPLKKVGGIILWAGHVEGVALGDLGDGRWDFLVLVHYPSKAKFLEMMRSEDYQVINKDRESGVEDHVILAADKSYSTFLI